MGTSFCSFGWIPCLPACTIGLFFNQFLSRCTIRAKTLPGHGRPRLRWGRPNLPPLKVDKKPLNGTSEPLDHFSLLPNAPLAEEGGRGGHRGGGGGGKRGSAKPSMSCPSGEACSMGERRVTVNRRTPEKSGVPRFEDDITVIDDNPVLVVPVLQEHEPKPKLQLPSVKPKGGGASKRWALLL